MYLVYQFITSNFLSIWLGVSHAFGTDRVSLA